jgi:hypothetical protein
MLTVDQLQKPEQIRAIETLQKSLPAFESLYTEQIDTDTMFPTNYSCFFNNLVRLPHGETWLWNQSNAKVNVELSDYVVLMQKMNTRRRKNGPKAPFYKLWLYSIKSQSDPNFSTQFIWCEKGAESAQSSPVSSPQQQVVQVHSPTLTGSSDSSPCYNSFEQVNMPSMPTIPTQHVFPEEPALNSFCEPSFSIPSGCGFRDSNWSVTSNEFPDCVDVDSILWPTYIYTDDSGFVSSFVDNYVAEEVMF